jgi:DHA3 family macrolide efflux protein-like MFS transporter
MTQATQSRSMRPFFIIWGGQAASLLGSNLVQFALVWWLTEKTGSATVLAVATMMAVLPQIILGPFAGALVDRWNRRLVMIVADSGIAIATLVLIALFATGLVEVWHVYALVFIRSMGASFHWPAMQASTTLMVPEEHLTRIAGMNQTLQGIANIAAPPLGALLLSLLPMHSVLAVDVITALIAITPLLFIPVPQPERAPDAAGQSPARAVLSDMIAGWRYVWAWQGMMVLIGLIFVLKIAGMPAYSLLPLLVSQHFHGDAAQYSMIEAAFGIGIVVGGLIMSVWGGFKRRIVTSLLGLAAHGLGMLAFGILPESGFRGAVATALYVGFTVAFVDAPLMAIMQARVAPEMQGRVFMLIGSLISLTSPLSLSVAGPAADAFGLQAIYVFAGVICVAIALSGAMIPTLTSIEENGHHPPTVAEQVGLPVLETDYSQNPAAE